jgi:hypothetical protein
MNEQQLERIWGAFCVILLWGGPFLVVWWIMLPANRKRFGLRAFLIAITIARCALGFVVYELRR